MKILTENQAKALNISSHIALTANAGSGKTTALTQRYIEIALNKVDIELSSIAAITFTEKAAGELFKKISEEFDKLAKKANGQQLELIKRRQRELIGAYIATIHSFCKDLIKMFPVEAGIGSDFTVIDAFSSRELIELAVEKTLSECLSSPKSELGNFAREAIRLLNGRNKLKLILIYLVDNRINLQLLNERLYKKNDKEASDALFYEYAKFVEGFVNYFEKYVFQAIKRINDNANAKNSNNVKSSVLEYLNKFNENGDFFEKLNAIQNIGDLILTDKGSVKSRGYLSEEREILFVDIQRAEEFFKEFYSAFPKKNSKDNIAVFFEPEKLKKEIELIVSIGRKLARLAEDAVKNYENYKLQENAIDFEDMLFKADRLLKLEKIQAELSKKFKYIMIDEFQDTNEIQYGIFYNLLDNLNSGNLFIVGDEKQSIYLFRNAEVEIFSKAKKDIASKNGKILSLPDSFRMNKEIAAFTNKVFSKVFEKKFDFEEEIEFIETNCAKQSDKPGIIEFLIYLKTKESKNNSKNIIAGDKEQIEYLNGNLKTELKDEAIYEDEEIKEAELIALKIIEIANENNGINFGDIAVLCRKRDYFEPLKKSLEKYRLPYIVEGDIGFFQSELFKDVMNYFSFLCDPSDDAALLAVLRSPFFFFSDDELLLIKLRSGEVDNYWSRIEKIAGNSKADDEFSTKVKKAWEVLKENILLAKTLKPSKIVRKIFLESDYFGLIAVTDETKKELSNLNKIIDLILKNENKKFLTLYDLSEHLKISSKKNFDEPEALASETSKAVKLITIHQAKGLQFKIVFVYGCGDRFDRKPNYEEVFIDKNFGIITKLPAEKVTEEKKHSALGAAYLYLRKRKELNEEKRIFYVACTRAEERLYLCGKMQEKSSDEKESNVGKKFSINKNSYFEYIKQAFPKLEDNLQSKRRFYLNSKLKILSSQENQNLSGYREEIISSWIEVKHLDDFNFAKDLNSERISENSKIELCEPKDYSKNLIGTFVENEEIYSPTKILTFMKCPLKYWLNFEISFGKISNFILSEMDGKGEEDNENDDISINIRPDKNEILHMAFGSLLHKLFELNPAKDKIDSILEKLVPLYMSAVLMEDKKINILKIQAKKIYLNFTESEFWKSIEKEKNFKTEFEVYVKEKDFFLHGIIDRVVFKEDKAIIIDFKTDVIGKKNFEERKKFYEKQLLFYALLLSKAFPSIKNFEGYLRFVRYPEKINKNFESKYTIEDCEKFAEEITEIIRKIRTKKFDVNTAHCSLCSYYNKAKSHCIYTTRRINE